MPHPPLIDVIIPCYNAATTLARAIVSVIGQIGLRKIIIVDDASTDQSVDIAKNHQQQFPHLIQIESLPYNGGVAKARNWGMLVSEAPVLAFLDADDAYQCNVLWLAQAVMQFRPEIPALRLALQPVNLDEKYLNHPEFKLAWRHVEMTVGGNMVLRRDFLLACGGFPQEDLFRRLGGEDVALSLAILQTCQMGTAFDDIGINDAAVLHYCHPQLHAYRILDALLFEQHNTMVSTEDHQQANAVTQKIVTRLNQLHTWTTVEKKGKIPLHLEF